MGKISHEGWRGEIKDAKGTHCMLCSGWEMEETNQCVWQNAGFTRHCLYVWRELQYIYVIGSQGTSYHKVKVKDRKRSFKSIFYALPSYGICLEQYTMFLADCVENDTLTGETLFLQFSVSQSQKTTFSKLRLHCQLNRQ